VLDPVARDILEGRLAYPTTRKEQVARFNILQPLGVTVVEMAHWCAVSVPTIKRWRRFGPEDKRWQAAQDRKPMFGKRPPKAQDGEDEDPEAQPDGESPAEGEAPADSPAPPAPATQARPAIGRFKAKGRAKGKQWSKELEQVSEADLADIFDGSIIRPDFDALRLLKGIASANSTPRPLKVQALRIIATHETNKGRIPWESIRVDQIPPEVQHRLAGMLLHLVAWDELPEEVRGASAARRKVWRELGILPETDAAAEAAIEAVAQAKAELRAALFPILPTPPRAPLQVSIAVEAGRAAVA